MFDYLCALSYMKMSIGTNVYRKYAKFKNISELFLEYTSVPKSTFYTCKKKWNNRERKKEKRRNL